MTERAGDSGKAPDRKLNILSTNDSMTVDDEATATGSDTTFAELGVHDDIVKALADASITSPFPIQELAIPLALTGADLIGQARTGTGKTLAFGVTILQRISLPGDDNYSEDNTLPQALVMCPTRELAVQVANEIDTAGKIRRARVTTIYGGVSYDDQLADLERGVDIVVGTPGRLLDLIDRGSLKLTNISVAVLDEADEMLDLGFLTDVERLLQHTPQHRQTLLFSATMPAEVMSLARAHLHHPINIRAEGRDARATVPDTTQLIYQAHELDKPEIVARILQSSDVDKVMIFCRMKRDANRLHDELYDRGFDVCVIHGDLNQRMREKSLKKFRTGKTRALVATDVAARGIDVTGVSHVINYECPEDDKSYVHRIGRTGRAGAKGIAVTLVDWTDVVRWKVINRQLNLEFDDPIETYSTSEHLYSDLNIPADAKGVVENRRGEREEKGSGRGRDGGRGRSRGLEGSRRRDGSDRGGRDSGDGKRRQRRRTRNGKPRHGTGEGPGQGADMSTPSPRQDQSDVTKSQVPRRRRRRTRNGKPTSGDSQAQ